MQAILIEQLTHGRTAGEGFDGIAEIFKRLALPGDEAGNSGKHFVQIESIERAEDRKRGQGEIQHDQVAAGLDHAGHLAHRVGPGGHVAQAKGDGDNIKRGIGHRQVHGIGHDPFHTRHLPLAGDFQHGLAEIRASDFRLRIELRNFHGQIPAARGQIQQTGGFHFANQPRDLAPPENVRAQGEDMIRGYVAAGDFGEGFMNEGGILHGGLNFGLLQQFDFADLHGFIDGLAHVVDGKRGHTDGGEGFHFHAGLCGSLGQRRDADTGRLDGKINTHFAESDLVAERNQLGGEFRGLEASDSGDAQHLAFLHLPGLQKPQRLRLKADASLGDRLASLDGLVGNIHHLGAALLGDVG